METKTGVIEIGERGSVSTQRLIPDDATAFLVYAHGAGAPMRHPFMEETATRLAEQGIATLRFNFLYAEAGRRRPDHRKVLLETIDAVLEHAATIAGGLPLFVGGKSMGGRMFSHADLTAHDVRGLLFFGFPLHAPGKNGTERARHLAQTTVPMLFLQGTRDRLAELSLITEVALDLGDRARLRVIEGADHGFHVLKRSGRSDADVMAELALEARRFIKMTINPHVGVFIDHISGHA